MIRVFGVLLVIIGYGLPTGYFFQAGFPIPAIFLIILGFSMISHYWLQTKWIPWIGLLFGLISNGVGAWLQFPQTETLLSVTMMIWCWDLSRFMELTHEASQEDDIKQLELQHVKRTSIFFLIIFSVSQLSLIIHLNPSFYQTIFLVLVAFVGVLQLVRFLITKSQN